MQRLPSELTAALRLPIIAAPMFLVSGPDLVIASRKAGIIGAFPTANCRTLDDLDRWLPQIVAKTDGAAPFAANLIVHRSNNRLQEDADLVAEHRTPLVIASVGSPAPIIDKIHAYGGKVFADIASLRHAEKAIAAGVDGLILLTAGAGGQTGWASVNGRRRWANRLGQSICLRSRGSRNLRWANRDGRWHWRCNGPQSSFGAWG